MIKYGTWKGEPASEEHWEVDWSIAEPDPEFLPGRDYFDALLSEQIESREEKLLAE